MPYIISQEHGGKNCHQLPGKPDRGICRTNVSDYSGNVLVAVKDAVGDTLISQTQAVSDSTQFATDVSSLEDGSYTITYTLEDSTVFAGEFEKE